MPYGTTRPRVNELIHAEDGMVHISLCFTVVCCCLLVTFNHILQDYFADIELIKHTAAPLSAEKVWRIQLKQINESPASNDINKTKYNKAVCIVYGIDWIYFYQAIDMGVWVDTQARYHTTIYQYMIQFAPDEPGGCGELASIGHASVYDCKKQYCIFSKNKYNTQIHTTFPYCCVFVLVCYISI